MNKSSLKILMLNYEFPPLGGGASPVSYDIAQRLSKQGHQIDIVTMSYKNLPSLEYLNPNLRVHRVTCLRSKKEIAYPFEQLTYLFSAFIKVINLIKKEHFDINYTHFIIPTGALSLILKYCFKLPYVITVHGSDVIGYNSRFKKIYPFLKGPWKKIIKSCSYLTVPTTFMLNKLIAVMPEIDRSRVSIVPNIIEPKRYKPLSKEKYILVVSRIHYNKGIQDLISAIANLDLRGWQIKIVGDGPYRGALEEMVKEKRLINSVEFIGWISDHKKLANLYGHASIYISTSYSESFSMTTIEAIMANCSCILSKTGVVEDLKNVYTYKVGDVQRLRLLIQQVIKNEDRLISDSDSNYFPSKVIPRLNKLLLKTANERN